MSWRKLDDDGHVLLVEGRTVPLDDRDPVAVQQRLDARLRLARGQWFADLDDGVDWLGLLSGTVGEAQIEAQVRERIRTTLGVTSLDRLTLTRGRRDLRITYAARVGDTAIVGEVAI
jgi:hypothetical protein